MACKVETAPVLRQGAGRGEPFPCCKLKVIFIVTGDDFAILLPVGISFKPQPRGRVLHGGHGGQPAVRAPVCVQAQTRTDTHVRTDHGHVRVGLAFSSGGESTEGVLFRPKTGLPAPGQGITALGLPELLLRVGFCIVLGR